MCLFLNLPRGDSSGLEGAIMFPLLLLLAPPAEPARPPGLARDLAPPVHVLAGGKPVDVERSGHAAPFVGDIDGDGKPALLVGQFDGGQLRIYRNTGKPGAAKLDQYRYFLAGGLPGSVQAG